LIIYDELERIGIGDHRVQVNGCSGIHLKGLRDNHDDFKKADSLFDQDLNRYFRIQRVRVAQTVQRLATG
jgi:hypothetical protein